MLEKALKVLDDILLDVTLSKKNLEEWNSKSDIALFKTEIKKLTLKVFSKNTKLLLFSQLLNDFQSSTKSISLTNFYIHESRNLLVKHQLKKSVVGLWKIKFAEVEPKHEGSAIDYSIDYHPITSRIESYYESIDNSVIFSHLKEIYNEILKMYCTDIDMLAYSNFSIKFQSIFGFEEVYKPDYSTSNEYIDMWLNDEITLDFWRRYPNTSFLSYLELNYPEVQIDKANQNQIRLFREALNIELKSLEANIKDLPRLFVKETIERQLSLIDNFVNGNYSELDFKRLSNIISFSRPDDVILAYDDLLRFGIYDFHKIIPYDGASMRKSPRFVAELLIAYRAFLFQYLNNGPEVIPTISNDKKIKPKSFGFIQAKKVDLFTSIMQKLQNKYDLIQNEENKVSDLVTILTLKDYRTFPTPIQIGCKTNVFCYIIREIKFLFNNLNGTSIGDSAQFKTLSSGILSSTNFNKSANSLSTQKKEEIDKILIKLKE